MRHVHLPKIDTVNPKHSEGNVGSSVTRLSSPATVGGLEGNDPDSVTASPDRICGMPLRGGAHMMGPSSWASRPRCL